MIGRQGSGDSGTFFGTGRMGGQGDREIGKASDTQWWGTTEKDSRTPHPRGKLEGERRWGGGGVLRDEGAEDGGDHRKNSLKRETVFRNWGKEAQSKEG